MFVYAKNRKVFKRSSRMKAFMNLMYLKEVRYEQGIGSYC